MEEQLPRFLLDQNAVSVVSWLLLTETYRSIFQFCDSLVLAKEYLHSLDSYKFLKLLLKQTFLCACG